MKKILFFYCFFRVLIIDALCAEESNVFAQTYLRLNAGKGIGYANGYVGIGLQLQLKNTQDEWLQPFIDARGHYFKDRGWATNLGICTRHFNQQLGKVFGGNVFYDFQEGNKGYHQVGLGLEILGCHYDLRLNGYLPVGGKIEFHKPHKYTYPGGYFAICQPYHKLLNGIDVEIATPYFAFGSYYYHQKCSGNILGGKCRLGYSPFAWINIEVRASYDSIFQTCVQGVLSISIPYRPQEIIRKPIVRQEIIVEGSKQCRWKTNYP